MSVRYLGSPALHKTSCRGRRPLISVDSACYIAANYRPRRDYYEHHRQRRLSQLLVARPHPKTHQRGTQCRQTGTGATIAQLVDAVVRFLSGSMEVDSRHESKGEHKEEKFVNEGLIKWKEGRKKWLAAATSGQKRPRRRPPRVDDEVILETIFAKPTGWLLPHPVPLAHMVELLEDEWSD